MLETLRSPPSHHPAEGIRERREGKKKTKVGTSWVA